MTSLYRMFDSEGALLYVGITSRLGQRISEHRHGQPWWTEVVSITVEHFDDRSSALAAERLAIASESPRWNAEPRKADLTVEMTPYVMSAYPTLSHPWSSTPTMVECPLCGDRGVRRGDWRERHAHKPHQRCDVCRQWRVSVGRRRPRCPERTSA